MCEFLWRRQEEGEGNVGVHEYGVAVVPEEPFEAVGGRERELRAEEREEEGMFGPEAREHAFTEDEGGVVVECVVGGVGGEGGFVDGLAGAEGGCYFCDFGMGSCEG